LQSIAITAPGTSIPKGTTDQFTAIGTFTDGSTQNITNSATWTSSNTAVASVSSTGLTTGTGIGSSNISAAQAGVTSNLVALTVTAATLQSIGITAVSSSIAKGATDQFTATGTFSDASTKNLTNSATWTSSNTGTATISSTGLATGTGVGSSNVSAAQGGVTSNIVALTVTAATLQSITITAPNSSVVLGNTEQLTATGAFSDSSTQNVTNSATWNSSNTAAATVSATGVLTAAAIGSTNITAAQAGITSNILAIAVIAQPHTVALTWTASTSAVAGYNVYRGTQSGGPYTLVNSILVTATGYTDITVLAGTTYFYVATAVDSSNDESVFSNEVPAVVPTP
jgi:trimeric autotransporter adhesin